MLDLERSLDAIRELKAAFGPSHHIHLYTSIPIDAEVAGRLAEAGLDELRFHLLDLRTTNYVNSITAAAEAGITTGVELPCEPDKAEALEQVVRDLCDLPVAFLNLNELEITTGNQTNMDVRGFNLAGGMSAAAEGSAELGHTLKGLAHDIEAHYHLKFCTAHYKDAGQLEHRFKRRATVTMRPYEVLSEDDTLLFGAIHARPNTPIPTWPICARPWASPSAGRVGTRRTSASNSPCRQRKPLRTDRSRSWRWKFTRRTSVWKWAWFTSTRTDDEFGRNVDFCLFRNVSMPHMPRVHAMRVACVVLLVLMLPLSGCLGGDGATVQSNGDAVDEVASACGTGRGHPQNMTVVLVDGVERQYRLTVPATDAGVALPIIIAFHGGGGAEEDFPQQNEFDALAQEEQFIMAYAIAEDDRTAAEGEWFLNTAATSREDNDFAEAIVDALGELYCIDDTRLYAIGYSLGSMFTYEVACQLNQRFAAVASFAGTMPVAPYSCVLVGWMGLMLVHV